MPTVKKPVITEAPCPKCGAVVQQADRRKTMAPLLGNDLWICTACGHPFNYLPRPHKAKRK